MKNQLATINKATFTKTEIIQRLVKFYLLWIVIGIISTGISVISNLDSFSWSGLLTSIFTWLLFGIIVVAIFDFVLTSFAKVHQLIFIQDGNKYELECLFRKRTLSLKLKEVFRIQIQSHFTKNTDKIFIKYQTKKHPKTISIIINHDDIKQIEFIQRHIK